MKYMAVGLCGAMLALSPLLGLLLPLPEVAQDAVEPVDIGNELDVGLALTLRSGASDGWPSWLETLSRS